MGGINIKKSEALSSEALSIKIQCDVCWNRQGKIFWSTFLHNLHLKQKGIQLSLVDVCLNVGFFLLLMKVEYPTLLIHCNIIAM